MYILGINQDLFDSGVAITDGRTVLYAANEERFKRKKNQGSFPWQSLEMLFEQTGIEPSEVGGIYVAGLMTPSLPMRIFPRGLSWMGRARQERRDSISKRLVDMMMFRTPVSHTSPDSVFRSVVRPCLAPALKRCLNPDLRRAPIDFVEHHSAHAASAWFLSGFEETLVITADGMGDGLSLTVNRCSGKGIERLFSVPSRDSFGMFFEMLTEAFEFVPARHEGKLTGLAAAGNARRVTVPSPFQFHDGILRYAGPLQGRSGVRWAKDVLMSNFCREDVAAWAQNLLESNLVKIANQWLDRTRLRRLAVAGGVFANVKLNQRLHQLVQIDELFVCPNMGDGGLSLGAVCIGGGLERQKLQNVFWGDSYDDNQIGEALGACPSNGHCAYLGGGR